MVAWFVASLVHRIYVYFAIGMLATLHGMFHLGTLTLYFFGAMIAVSVCLARLLYEAGIETGIGRSAKFIRARASRPEPAVLTLPSRQQSHQRQSQN